MKTFASSRALFPLLLGSVVLAFASAVACSGTKLSPPAASDACTTLSACCAGMTGAQATTCDSIVSSSRQANSESTCTSALQSFQQGGLCGGNGFEAGSLPSFDAGTSCVLTGTCPTNGGDAGVSADGGSATRCQLQGTCTNGETEEVCATFTDGGACSAAYVFSGGTQISCASCSNCTGAATAAQAYCGTTVNPTPDAAPVCGLPPVLHPEIEAGVYCPFTATGAVHCGTAQECCETPSTTPNGSTCQALGATCPVTGSLAWQCDGPVDCQGSAAGPVCCAAGTVAADPSCGFKRGSGFTGSHCAQACATGELPICASTTDPCVSGTCTPFKVAGIVLGTCQ